VKIKKKYLKSPLPPKPLQAGCLLYHRQFRRRFWYEGYIWTANHHLKLLHF